MFGRAPRADPRRCPGARAVPARSARELLDLKTSQPSLAFLSVNRDGSRSGHGVSKKGLRTHPDAPECGYGTPARPSSFGPAAQSRAARAYCRKKRWASSLTVEQARAGFKGWHERGYLPHRDEPGLTQMVTFHVRDSFPTALRSEWAALLDMEDNAERRKKLQAYLDRGRGECPLRETPKSPRWSRER